jgi:DNA polymerase-3 subunit delta'
MPRLEFRNLIGQDKIKEVLSAAYANNSLGHAYLFSSEPGAGKFVAALELGMALVCRDQTAVPCYSCDACRKVLNHAHPDLRVIFPVALATEHKSDNKLTEKGWAYLSECALARIRKPYLAPTWDGLPTIPVEWVRETNHAVLRGALEGGRNVTIIDDVDTLNKESANAMLKVLEEPPAGTIFILISSKAHAVLPTIVSRCQNLRFGCIPPDRMRAALAGLYPSLTDDQASAIIDFSMGSLGRAIRAIEHPVSEAAQAAEKLWALCAQADWALLAPLIDELSAADNFDLHEQLIMHLLHRARSTLLNQAASGNYFKENAGSAPTHAANRMYAACQHALSSIRSRGNVPLVLVNFMFDMVEILHVEKQQAG